MTSGHRIGDVAEMTGSTTRRWWPRTGASVTCRSAVARGVFGSSTIVFASGRGSFVRFAGIPSVDHAGDILDPLRTIADRAPELDHLEPLRT